MAEIIGGIKTPLEVEEEARVHAAIREVAAVMHKHRVLFDPYLEYTDHGVVPRLRFVPDRSGLVAAGTEQRVVS